MIDRRHLLTGLMATFTGGLSACSNSVLKLAENNSGAPGKNPFAARQNDWTKDWGGDSPGDTSGTKPVTRRRLPAPTVEELMKPGPLKDRALGKADAPVTVIEYASLTCPYCRAFHLKTFQRFKRQYIDTGKVRFILREFPIGRASGTATIIWRCAGEQGHFIAYDQFITNQRLWVSQKVSKEKIFAVASRFGMSREKFDSCFKDQKLVDDLKWVKQRARELGVIGTPTFFINGKQYRGPLTFDQMKAAIEPHLV